MGPFIPPLPVESCVAAFLWITTYLVSTISTTSITDYICFDSTVKLKQSIHFIQQYSRKEIFTMVQCKKQPIVQLEPLDLVSTVQLNTNI